MRKTILILAMTMTACGSMEGVRAEHAEGGGTARIYDVPPSAAYAAAVSILRRESGIATVEEHASDGVLYAHKEESIFRPGAYIGVWIEPSGSDHCRVVVVTKRETSIQWATGWTEGGFQSDLAAELTRAKRDPQNASR